MTKVYNIANIQQYKVKHNKTNYLILVKNVFYLIFINLN